MRDGYRIPRGRGVAGPPPPVGSGVAPARTAAPPAAVQTPVPANDDRARKSFAPVLVLNLVALAIVALLMVLLFRTPARAHQAMSGWNYPYECCSGRDCAQIDAGMVREAPGDGWIVTVAAGSHPMWGLDRPGPLLLHIYNLDTRLSPDGRFHLCIDATGKTLCFYAAIGGS